MTREKREARFLMKLDTLFSQLMNGRATAATSRLLFSIVSKYERGWFSAVRVF